MPNQFYQEFILARWSDNSTVRRLWFRAFEPCFLGIRFIGSPLTSWVFIQILGLPRKVCIYGQSQCSIGISSSSLRMMYFQLPCFFTWVCLKVWWTRMMLGKHALAAKRLVQLRSLDKWFRDELHSQPGSILGTAQQWCGLVWGELCTHQVCGGVLQYHVIHPHVDRIPLGSLPMLQIRTGSALLLVLVGYRCRWRRKRGIPWHPTSNWWRRLSIQHFASSEFKPILMAL